MDNWIVATQGSRLRAAADPLVVDLGYGASPVTTIEFAQRLRRVRPDVRVVGVEIDVDRVASAAAAAEPPRLTFAHGGFEFGGLRPSLVRAANVLRQYDEQAGARAWQVMCAGLAEGGVLVEGTCDEIGRRASWVLLDGTGPISLTLACRTTDIERPSDLAERLPKSLIHRNVPGEPIHRFLRDLDTAWEVSAGLAVFGARQRWSAACRGVSSVWRVDLRRVRHGEITVPWADVAPT